MIYVLRDYDTAVHHFPRPPNRAAEFVLRLAVASCRIPASPPKSAEILRISNRYNKLLEFPVTRTKQTIRPISNRYKNTLSQTRIAALSRNTRNALVATLNSAVSARILSFDAHAQPR